MRLPRLLLVASFVLSGVACAAGFARLTKPSTRACVQDSECHVVVDCCAKQYVSVHDGDGYGTCRLFCPELENPPEAACVEGQCSFK